MKTFSKVLLDFLAIPEPGSSSKAFSYRKTLYTSKTKNNKILVNNNKE